MSDLIQSRSDIEKVLHESDFVAATFSQINKDLREIDAQIQMENNKDPLNSFINQLGNIFKELGDTEKLAHFIYRVDLNEVDFKNALFNSNWTELAYLVIRREAQKVYLRRRFA
ncbi:hypothetical protein N8987_01225 [Crocinitomix sp.]|nr:hypothetical protein [Crocinitomix sp.]